MKKIVAFALVMLMVFSCVAYAEPTASVLTFTDPEISLTTARGPKSVTLTGLKIVATVGQDGSTPTVNAVVTDGNAALLSGTIQLRDGSVVVYVDGMSNAYKIDLNDVIQNDGARALATGLLGSVSISGLNVGAILNTLTNKAMGGAGTAIPTGKLTSLAKRLLDAFGDTASARNINTAYLKKVISRIARRVTLTGSYQDNRLTATVSQGGRRSATVSAALSTSTAGAGVTGITAEALDVKKLTADQRARAVAEGNTILNALIDYAKGSGLINLIPAP